jgi:DNA primase
MAFSANFLDEIRARIPLASIIGQNVRLTRKGREYSGLCPFHNEKTPSFTVNEEKGFFHCFGCGAHGDVITYEMRAGHMSFPEAVEKLAGLAGLAMPEQSPVDREQERRAASLHDVLDRAARWFTEQLAKPAGREARDYLSRRGLDEETIARFRLGFSPDSRSGLKDALGKELESLAVEAGLLIRPEEGNGPSYDRFRGRVIFPITDRRGRVIAFGGRIMGEGQPKYLNSPDTPLFHKGHVLYGWAHSREAAVKAGTFLVAEGYMDVIALHRAGFTNAVAPLGTALTEAQIEWMWRQVAEPIVCLDGDAAGQRAAIRAAERALTILKPGHSLRFASLPVPEDPDSLIQKQGAAAMQKVCDAAISMADTLWAAKIANLPLATPEQRAGAEAQIKDLLAVIPDQGLKRDYFFEFVGRLRAAARAQRPAAPWRGGVQPKAKARSYAARDAQGRVLVTGLKPSAVPPPAAATQERLLLQIALDHPALLDEVAESLGEVQFADSNLDKLRQDVLIHAHGYAGLDREAVYNHLRSRGFSQTLDCLLEAGAHDPSAIRKPDISIDEVRRTWRHVYGLYRQKELAADFEAAKLRSAADLTDETFGYVNALWSGLDRGGDL